MSRLTPQSLNSPQSADVDVRRSIKDAAAATSAPSTAADGANTRGHEYVHLSAKVSTAGSAALTLWGWYEFAGVWGVLGWFGSGGTVVVDFGSPLIAEPLLIAGIDRVAVQVSAIAGGGTVDVWLGGSSVD